MDLDLNGLEDRVGHLVALCRRLRSENGALRQQLVVANNDNKLLAERIEQAKVRLDALLARMPAAQAIGDGDD